MKRKIPTAFIVAWYAALAALLAASLADDHPLSYRLAWCGLALALHSIVGLIIRGIWCGEHDEF